MFNNFKMLTSLSWQDVYTQGSVIGFYPDTAGAFNFHSQATPDGHGVCSNRNSGADHADVTGAVWWCDPSPNDSGVVATNNATEESNLAQLRGASKQSNKGMYERQKFMNNIRDTTLIGKGWGRWCKC
jgi:hypothetical protein